MAYNQSLYLFWFLPISLIIYQLMPKKARPFVLLAFSWIFFLTLSRPVMLVWLLAAAGAVYSAALYLDRLSGRRDEILKLAEKSEKAAIRKRFRRKKLIILWISTAFLLGTLVFFKYYFSYALYINTNMGGHLWYARLGSPIGISFYTLEAISYTADVYWERQKADRNFFRVTLFLSFFPQLMEGPICQYKDTAELLFEGSPVVFENVKKGALRILWGLFKKMIIADRLLQAVDNLYGGYTQYHGVMFAVAAVIYTIHLYMDFSGTIDIVIGSAEMFGIPLKENFRQPFFAQNAGEFWRRWHISLGAWFKAYLFYPVSVSGIVKKWNKFARKKIGKYLTNLGTSALCLLPVWLATGIWHGPQLNYLFYGLYYFVILFAEVAWLPVKNAWVSRFHVNEEAWSWKIPHMLKTWVIIFCGEMLFNAKGIRAAAVMYRSIFTEFDGAQLINGGLLEMGIDTADLRIVVIAVAVVAVVETLTECGKNVSAFVLEGKFPVRFAAFAGLALACVIFGAYGAGYLHADIIYAGF